jgi:hypothetical protein
MATDRNEYIARNSEYNYNEDLVSFSLVDESTVRKLQKDGKVVLPQKKINIPKDMRWNEKQMGSKLMQGIQNGYSIPKIANSLLEVIGNNKASATRNARTMTTSAENGGRLDSYKDLQARGVVQKKKWMATPDDRTRKSHIDIDGEEQDIDAEFSNGCMYPADGHGPSEEVWNCRCSMHTHIIGFRRADGSISRVNYDRDKTMHDTQMDAEKARRAQLQAQKGQKATPTPAKDNAGRVESAKIEAVLSEADYAAFMDLVNNADNAGLYGSYADDIGRLEYSTTEGGSYSKGYNRIVFSLEKGNYEGIDAFSTLAHEYNHFFDAKIGRNGKLSFNEIDLINQKCQIGSGSVKILKETPSQSDEFLAALRKDMEILKAKGLRECYNEFNASRILHNSTSGVQDALDGFFGTQKTFNGWGHGNKYYNRQYNKWIKSFGKETELKDALNSLGMDASNQTKAKNILRQYEAASEAWANVGSAITCKGPEYDAIQKYMPNTLAAYKKIIGGI